MCAFVCHASKLSKGDTTGNKGKRGWGESQRPEIALSVLFVGFCDR